MPDRMMRKPLRAERPVTLERKDRMAGDAKPQLAEVIPEALKAEAMAETVKATDHDDTPHRKSEGFEVGVTERIQGSEVQLRSF
jgi:hypothetical protein